MTETTAAAAKGIDERIVDAVTDKKLRLTREIAEAIKESPVEVQAHLRELVAAGRISRRESDGFISYHPPEPAAIPVPQKDLSYGQKEERVLAAIDAKKRTINQLKGHAGFERSYDISDLIESMIADKKIRREDNGSFTAYFRYETMPKRFWITGDSTVEAEFIESYRPRDEEKKARELSAFGDQDEPSERPAIKPAEISPDELEKLAASLPHTEAIAQALGLGLGVFRARIREPKLRAAYQRGVDWRRKHVAEAIAQNSPSSETEKPAETSDLSPTALQPAASPTANGDAAPQFERFEQPKQRRPRRGKTDALTPEIVFAAASVEPDVKAITKLVGLSLAAYYLALKKNPKLKDAHEKGREKYAAENVADRPRGRLQFTPGELEEAASTNSNMTAVAKALGYKKQPALKKMLERHPELQASYDRGRIRFYDAIDTPVEVEKPETHLASDVIEPIDIAEPAEAIEVTERPTRMPSRIQMELDAEDEAKPVELMRPPFEGPMERFGQPRAQHAKQVDLRAGTLSVALAGNIFEMSPADIELVGKIAALMQERENDDT